MEDGHCLNPLGPIQVSYVFKFICLFQTSEELHECHLNCLACSHNAIIFVHMRDDVYEKVTLAFLLNIVRFPRPYSITAAL